MTELPDDMEAAELRLRDCLGEATEANVAVDTGDLRALLLAYKERGRALEGARDSLLGIALSDRYRRYPKQHKYRGVRGQSGLRAVRALTGQNGSYLSDDDVVRLDKEARATLNQKGKSHE
jgi:hypothetical protein